MNKIENAYDLDIRSFTFEDFPMSLTGQIGGRQDDYNRFIQNDANIVIFIIDSFVGKITNEEFDVAYKSLKENNKPDIFVYVRKRFFANVKNSKLKNIVNKVVDIGKEYYVEYDDMDSLRYLFYRDITNYMLQRKSNLNSFSNE